MKRMKRTHRNFLLRQLNILQEEGLLSAQKNEQILEFYKSQGVKGLELQQKKAAAGQMAILILSIISSILIGGGIILVIGFNWKNIPFGVKTAIAFLLSAIPFAVAAFFRFDNKRSWGSAAKESISLVWALAFGASVALMGQILKLPASPETLLALLAGSTLLISFVFNTMGTQVLYLTLIVIFTTVMQFSERIGTFFLPMALLYLPHFIREQRSESTFRKIASQYLFLAALSAGLAISLEKAIPGLWMILYGLLFSCFILTDKFILQKLSSQKNLKHRPFLLAGYSGLLTMGVLLVFSYFFEDIGWKHYRMEEKFNGGWAIVDYCIIGLFLIYYLFLIFKMLKQGIKKRPLPVIIAAFAPLLILSLFILQASDLVSSEFSVSFIALSSTIILILLMLRSLKKKEGKISLPLILLSLPALFYGIIVTFEIEAFLFLPGIISTGIITFAFSQFKRKAPGVIWHLVHFGALLWTAVFLLVFTFQGPWEAILESLPKIVLSGNSWWILFMLNQLLLVFFGPALVLIFRREKNHLEDFNGSYLIAPVLLLGIIIVSLFNQSDHLYILYAWAVNLFILIISLWAIIKGFNKGNLAQMNIFAGFLGITIILRFFDSEMPLLLRGGIFIAVGIFILLLNVSLSKRMKRSSES